MHKTSWRLQHVGEQFSAMADTLLNGQAKLVSRQSEHADPSGFIEHLLAMPRHVTNHLEQPAKGRPVMRLRDAVVE
ncbi:MAG: hypothetical protein H7Y61_00930 [Rhizobiales bacterium]|nr:hypothetical protein [Rhizobacter sp.]